MPYLMNNTDTTLLASSPSNTFKTLPRNKWFTDPDFLNKLLVEISIYNTDTNALQFWGVHPASVIMDPVNGYIAYHEQTAAGAILELNSAAFVKSYGILSGNYRVTYKFYENAIGANTGTDSLFISAISPSRQEIEVSYLNTALEDSFVSFTKKYFYRNSKQYAFNKYVNFGNDVLALVLNSKNQVNSDGTQTLILKLYDVLSTDIAEKANLWITHFIIDEVEDTVSLEAPATSATSSLLYIADPDFTIDVKINKSQYIPYANYNDLIPAQSPLTVFSSDLTNKTNLYSVGGLFTGFATASDLYGINLFIDYSQYKNYVHFASAQSMLSNFYDKISKLELYSLQLYTSSLSSSVTTSFAGSSSIIYQNKINDIFNSFTRYEKFLYYESGSYFTSSYIDSQSAGATITKYDATWPKTGSAYPYVLYSTASTAVQNWYSDLLQETAWYDENNKDSLYNFVPEYIRLDPDGNADYLNFVNMIGEFFDNVWTYVEYYYKIQNRAEKLANSAPAELIWNILNNYGLNVNNGNDLVNLTKYYYGYDTTPSSSAELQTAEDLVTKEIWNRFLNNYIYMYKSRGTEKSIYALLNSYGVPRDLLTIREYGGFAQNTPNVGREFIFEDFTHVVDFEGSQSITVPWKKAAYGTAIQPFSSTWSSFDSISITSGSISSLTVSGTFYALITSGSIYVKGGFTGSIDNQITGSKTGSANGSILANISGSVSGTISGFAAGLRITSSKFIGEIDVLASASVSGSADQIYYFVNGMSGSGRLPDGIELKFRALNRGTSYEIFKVTSSTANTSFDLTLQRFTASGIETGSYYANEGNVGKLVFSMKPSSGNTVLMSSSYYPFYDENFYSVLIQRSNPSDTATSQTYTMWVKKYDELLNRTTITSTSSLTVTQSSYTNIFASSGTLYLGGHPESSNKFSGSIDEFRLWGEYINLDTFDFHAKYSLATEGVGFYSSLQTLIARMDFNTVYNLATTASIPNEAFNAGYATSFTTNNFTNEPDYPFNFSYYERISTITNPFLTPGSSNDNKIRLVDSYVSQSVLNSTSRINPLRVPSGSNFGNKIKDDTINEYVAIEGEHVDTTYTQDSDKVIIAFSAADLINDDIMAFYGNVNIMDPIADPMYIDLNYYPGLTTFRNIYSRNTKNDINAHDYLQYLNMYDKSMYDQIRDLIPVQANAAVGILYEQTMLYRNRFKLIDQSANNVEQEQTTIPQQDINPTANAMPNEGAVLSNPVIANGDVESKDAHAIYTFFTPLKPNKSEIDQRTPILIFPSKYKGVLNTSVDTTDGKPVVQVFKNDPKFLKVNSSDNPKLTVVTSTVS